MKLQSCKSFPIFSHSYLPLRRNKTAESHFPLTSTGIIVQFLHASRYTIQQSSFIQG